MDHRLFFQGGRLMRIFASIIVVAGCLAAVAGCHTTATIEKTVPSGTSLVLELVNGVSSAGNTAGDAVSARVAQDIVVAGKVVIPQGSTVSGKVTQARGLKKIGGRALLGVEFHTVDLPTGSTSIRAAFFREGKSETKKDAATIAGATAGGAILGRVLSKDHEARGTAIGAIVGGGAGTAIAAGTHGEEIVLPAGTRLSLHLQGPTTVKVEA
jgi:hypothetical protein